MLVYFTSSIIIIITILCIHYITSSSSIIHHLRSNRYHRSYKVDETLLLRQHNLSVGTDHISRYRTSVSKYSCALASSRGDGDEEYADTILVRIRAVTLVGALALYRLLYIMIHTDREYVGDDHRHNSNINNPHHNDNINDDARSNDERTRRVNDYAAISSVISSSFQSFDYNSTAAALKLVSELMLRHCSHDAFQHYLMMMLSSNRMTSMQGEACSMNNNHHHSTASYSDDESTLLLKCASSHAHARAYYQELPEILKILCELSYEVLIIIDDDDGDRTHASMFRAGMGRSTDEMISSTIDSSSSSSSSGEYQRGVDWSIDIMSTSEHLISVINSSLDLLLVMVSPVYISIVEEMSLDFYLFCGMLILIAVLTIGVVAVLFIIAIAVCAIQ